ncbi:hypothetical protein FRC15_003811 [Serendipita sp. 397]|nr:hypothetical protein FRC15_003811 [Serendipita sp. 397]
MTALSYLESALSDVYTSRYLTLAAFTLCVYDWMLLFGDELELVGKSRWSLGKGLYYFSRIITPIGLTAALYQLIPEARPHLSRELYNFYVRMSFNGIELVNCQLLRSALPGLLMLRLVALYKSKPLIVWTLYIGLLLAWITTTGVLLSAQIFFARYIQYTPLLGICATTQRAPTLSGIFYGPLVFEILLLSLTIYHAWGEYRSQRGVTAVPLLRVLYRDGVLFAVVMLAVRVWNIIIYAVGPLTQTYLGIYMMWAAITVLSSRIYINMVKMAYHNAIQREQRRYLPPNVHFYDDSNDCTYAYDGCSSGADDATLNNNGSSQRWSGKDFMGGRKFPIVVGRELLPLPSCTTTTMTTTTVKRKAVPKVDEGLRFSSRSVELTLSPTKEDMEDQRYVSELKKLHGSERRHQRQHQQHQQQRRRHSEQIHQRSSVASSTGGSSGPRGRETPSSPRNSRSIQIVTSPPIRSSSKRTSSQSPSTATTTTGSHQGAAAAAAHRRVSIRNRHSIDSAMMATTTTTPISTTTIPRSRSNRGRERITPLSVPEDVEVEGSGASPQRVMSSMNAMESGMFYSTYFQDEFELRDVDSTRSRRTTLTLGNVMAMATGTGTPTPTTTTTTTTTTTPSTGEMPSTAGGVDSTRLEGEGTPSEAKRAEGVVVGGGGGNGSTSTSAGTGDSKGSLLRRTTVTPLIIPPKRKAAPSSTSSPSSSPLSPAVSPRVTLTPTSPTRTTTTTTRTRTRTPTSAHSHSHSPSKLSPTTSLLSPPSPVLLTNVKERLFSKSFSKPSKSPRSFLPLTES